MHNNSSGRPRSGPNPSVSISDDQRPRDRDDELGPPLARVRQLLEDLVLEVPGEYEDVVGPSFSDPLGSVDRDVRAREEAALLVRVAVDGEVDEVAADPAVVEQRVALTRRSVAGDRLALTLDRREQFEE